MACCGKASAGEAVLLQCLETWQRNATRATNLPLYYTPSNPFSPTDQERVVEFGNTAKQLLQGENVLDVELLKPMCNLYDKLTANWYLQQIAVPNVLAYIIYQRYNSILGVNAWVDCDTAQLLLTTLQKAINAMPAFRDTQSNGHGQAVPIGIYLKMMDAGQVPYLEAAEKRRVAVSSLLEDDLHILPISKVPMNGTYVDGSTLYHDSGYASTLAYNLSMFYFLSAAKECGVSISDQKWSTVVYNIADTVYGSFTQPMSFGRGVSRQRGALPLTMHILQCYRVYAGGDLLDCLQSTRHYSSNPRVAVSTKYARFAPITGGSTYRNALGRFTRKVEGSYTWYGRNNGDYDGYNITSSLANVETVTPGGKIADDLSVNTNFRTLFSFTDEPILDWVKDTNFRGKPLYLGGLLMSGTPNNWIMYDDAFKYRQKISITSLSACLGPIHSNIDVVYVWQSFNTGQVIAACEVIGVIDRYANGITYFIVPQVDASHTSDGTLVRLALTGVYGDGNVVSVDRANRVATLRSPIIRNRYVSASDNANVFAMNVGYTENAAPKVASLTGPQTNVVYDCPIPYTVAYGTDSNIDGYNQNPDDVVGAPAVNQALVDSTTAQFGLNFNHLLGIEMSGKLQLYSAFVSSVAQFERPDVTVVGLDDAANWCAKYRCGNRVIELCRFDKKSKTNWNIVGNDAQLLNVRVLNDGSGKTSNTILSAAFDPLNESPTSVLGLPATVTMNESFAFIDIVNPYAAAC